MIASDSTGISRHERIGKTPQGTASIPRRRPDQMVSGYFVDAEGSHDAERLETALRGEIDG